MGLEDDRSLNESTFLASKVLENPHLSFLDSLKINFIYTTVMALEHPMKNSRFRPTQTLWKILVLSLLEYFGESTSEAYPNPLQNPRLKPSRILCLINPCF